MGVRTVKRISNEININFKKREWMSIQSGHFDYTSNNFKLLLELYLHSHVRCRLASLRIQFKMGLERLWNYLILDLVLHLVSVSVAIFSIHSALELVVLLIVINVAYQSTPYSWLLKFLFSILITNNYFFIYR